MSQPDPPLDARRAVARGLVWNGLYQVFSIAAQFGAMLVMVRLVAPADYGRWATVLALLQVLNSFGCGSFMAHALQAPEGHEPDWTLHWHCGLWIQLWLTLGCLALAGASLLVPTYADLAPLLAVASLGLLIDTPSRLRTVQLQRSMNYRRLRLAGAVSTISSIAVSIALAATGWGATALVVGGNVVATLGFSLDLLVVARWRPAGAWVRWPTWTAYREPLRFGMYQSGGGLLRSGRAVATSMVLVGTLGYEVLGLLGRAEALFASTVQRVTAMIGETVYPLLPRCAADGARFKLAAREYVGVSALFLLPGAAFVVAEGPLLSELLYGARWRAADPFIAPLAISGALMVVAGLAYRVLLARGRLRACLGIDVVSSVLGVALALATLVFPVSELYAWGAAATAAVVLGAAVLAARSEDLRAWIVVLGPPAVASGFGAAALLLVRDATTALPAAGTVTIRAAALALAFVAALRLLFPTYLRAALLMTPGARRALTLLRLDPGHDHGNEASRGA